MTFDPDWTIAPGETLQEWLDENGLNPRMLAKVAGCDVSVIEAVLKKKRYSRHTAAILAKGTFIPAHVWMALEDLYRHALARGKKDVS